MTSQDWGDPAKAYADSVMGLVQTIAGPTADGRRRDQVPYYHFGALYEQSAIPATPMPAVQWRQTDGHFSYTREMSGPGLFQTGSLGSWVMDYEVKFFGQNRSQVFNEFLYFIQAVMLAQQPNPPISNVQGHWLEPGKAQQNAKETMRITFTAPVAIPLPIDDHATILSVTSSFEMPPAPLSGSVPPITGSYNVVRRIVVT